MKIPRYTLILAAIAFLAECSPRLAGLMEWQRGSGDLWRPFTSHLAHWSHEHFAWDVIVFIVFGALAEKISPRAFLGVFLGASLAILAALQLPQSAFSTYRGLSGIDSALFVFVVTHWLRAAAVDHDRRGCILAGAMLASFLVKSAVELSVGHPIFVNATDNFIAAPVAHLAGGLAGVVAACGTGKVEFARLWGRVGGSHITGDCTEDVSPMSPV